MKQLVARHGRWLGLNPKDLKRAANWFDRHKFFAIFVGRLLPAIRSLISVPAGFAAMAFILFPLASLLGTTLWTAVLAPWAIYRVLNMTKLTIGWIRFPM